MLHDEILLAFPDLEPLMELHLSETNGVPMHAIANGWYWAGGTEWNNTGNPSPPGILASHLRISVQDAQSVVEAVTAGTLSSRQFSTLVDALKPAWQAQADRAISFLEGGQWPEPNANEKHPDLSGFTKTVNGPKP